MVRRWRALRRRLLSRFPIFGRVVYVADPALVKEVFTGDPAVFHAGEANALALGDALGDHSLLTLDEDRHMSQRKLLLPPFHGESVRRYAEVMAEATAREVATWPRRRGDRAAAAHAGDHARGDPASGVRRARRRADGPVPRAHPARSASSRASSTGCRSWTATSAASRPRPGSRRALAAVDELIYAEIAERRAEGDDEGRDDVLSLLLRARHEDGSPMTRQRSCATS